MQKGTLKGWTTRKQLLLNRRAILLKALSKRSIESQVLCAETLFCDIIAEHNIAFLAADHFSEICKKMFSDSKIAAQFACKRTKCTK